MADRRDGDVEAFCRNGYALFTVAPGTKSRLLDDILRTVARGGPPVRDLAALSQRVAGLADETFRTRFAKPFRFFTPAVADTLDRLARDCARLAGGSDGWISRVSPAEVDANPELDPQRRDAFWRCVRPHKPDVGAPHADVQFWDLARDTRREPYPSGAYDRRVKVWIPLAGCDAQNSLQVAAGSHREAVPFETQETETGLRPGVAPAWLAGNRDRFVCPLTDIPAQCVVFDDRLVHAGPPNAGRDLRLSAEFTILVRDS